MDDRAFIRGAKALLSDYARFTAGESAVFVFDPDVTAVCQALEKIAKGAGVEVRTLPAACDWTKIQATLNDRCDAVIFLESGSSHHSSALLDFLATRDDRPRAYRLFGATAETVRNGFKRSRLALCRRNWGLIETSRRAGRITVESDQGTHLVVGLDPTAPWTNTYGAFADGYPGILPPSEVNTRSADVNGDFVVDGAIASNIGWPLDVRLGANPLTLPIRQGKVTAVDCGNPLVRNLVEEFLAVPGCNEVVEIGIGTNDGIDGFVPADILLNERVASFHLGVGSADAEDPAQNLHIDFILGDCRVFMGDQLVLSNGRFSDPTSETVPDRHAYEVPIRLHDAL